MAYGTQLGPILLLLALSWRCVCLVDFKADFDHVVQGGNLELAWDELDTDNTPLALGVSLINETGNHKVFGLKTDISHAVNGTSFSWQGVPYPAEYIPTALYRLELRPSMREDDIMTEPVLARSPYFSIHPAPTASGSDTSSSDAHPEQPTNSSDTSKKLPIALSLALGIPSVLAASLVCLCFRRRRRKAAEERIRRMRMEFLIH